MNVSDEKPVVLSVNQDAGIGPKRTKGAAVHLNAMRVAFAALGTHCHGIDEADDLRLAVALNTAFEQGPIDVIYERYALGKSTSSHFAMTHQIPLVLEVNAPLADEQRRWRGGSDEMEEARNDAIGFKESCGFDR